MYSTLHTESCKVTVQVTATANSDGIRNGRIKWLNSKLMSNNVKTAFKKNCQIYKALVNLTSVCAALCDFLSLAVSVLLRLTDASTLTCTAAGVVLWNSLRKTAETTFCNKETLVYNEILTNIKIDFKKIPPTKKRINNLSRAKKAPQRRHLSFWTVPLSSTWRRCSKILLPNETRGCSKRPNRRRECVAGDFVICNKKVA